MKTARDYDVQVQVPGGRRYNIVGGAHRVRDFWESIGLSRVVVDGGEAHWYFGNTWVCGVDGNVATLRKAIRGWRKLGQLHVVNNKRSACVRAREPSTSAPTRSFPAAHARDASTTQEKHWSLDLARIVASAPKARVAEIHTHPCAHCPSANSEPDPETRDYMAADRETQLESVFRCGWRPTKACKGYCDLLGITADDLRASEEP